MKIGIDVQTIGRERSGDETYYRNLLAHYGVLRPDNDYFLYYTNTKAEPFLESLSGRFHARKLAIQNPFLRVPLSYPWRMLREPVDVFHTQYVGVAARGAKLVLTVQDLSYELYPETFPTNRALFLKMTRWSAKWARLILACSESTKRDLVKLYGLPPEKIRVIHLAAHERFTPASPEDIRRVKAKFGLANEKGYILSVGNRQPRKNLKRLVEAYKAAKQRGALDIPLVLVGKKGWGASAETEFFGGAEGGDIRLTGYVADEDLPALYSGASFFAYPSIYEGFGLPVLEAMRCGTPVLTSKVSSIPEVGGDAVYYADPFNVADIARGLVALADAAALRENFRRKGLVRASLFSWEEAARRTLSVYEEAAGVSSAMPVKPFSWEPV